MQNSFSRIVRDFGEARVCIHTYIYGRTFLYTRIIRVVGIHTRIHIYIISFARRACITYPQFSLSYFCPFNGPGIGIQMTALYSCRARSRFVSSANICILSIQRGRAATGRKYIHFRLACAASGYTITPRSFKSRQIKLYGATIAPPLDISLIKSLLKDECADTPRVFNVPGMHVSIYEIVRSAARLNIVRREFLNARYFLRSRRLLYSGKRMIMRCANIYSYEFCSNG